MSKLGWAARLGGYALAPWTGGASIGIGNTAAQGIETVQGMNDGPGGSNGGGKKPDGNPEDPYTQMMAANAGRHQKLAGGYNQAGGEGIDAAINYIKQLTGSDPSGVMDATRQERGRVIDQFDTGRRAVETFGPRGGGMTSALASSRFNQATSLADITSTARRDAFSLAATLGPQLAQLGITAEALASADLDAVIRTLFAREGINTEKRGQNMAMVGDLANAGGTLLGAWMNKDKGNSGGGGGTGWGTGNTTVDGGY